MHPLIYHLPFHCTYAAQSSAKDSGRAPSYSVAPPLYCPILQIPATSETPNSDLCFLSSLGLLFSAQIPGLHTTVGKISPSRKLQPYGAYLTSFSQRSSFALPSFQCLIIVASQVFPVL